MNKKSKEIRKVPNRGNTPKLRFPKFSGEWKQTTLGECSVSLQYGMNSASKAFDGKNKYIRITDIDETSSKYVPDVIVSPKEDLEEKYLVRENDILLARTGASTGKSYLYNIKDGKLYFAGFLIRVKVNHLNNANFIFNQTKTAQYQKWVKIMSMRSGQPGINSKEYASFKFWVSSKLEQDKIASFLKLLDDCIQTQNKIIQHQESLIKGFSQKLFSQQIRFKDDDGNNFFEWNEKGLDKIGKTINGLTGKTKKDFGKGKPYIQYKQIFYSSRIDIKDCGLVDIKDSENQVKVKYGDVFFTISSETPDEIGTSAVLLNDVEEMYLNSFCFGFRMNPNLLNPLFSRFLFRSESFRNKIIPLAQGSTRYNISKSSFLKLKITIPNLEEQTKIANILTSLHAKLEKEKQILEKYQEQKKFLLQNIFV